VKFLGFLVPTSVSAVTIFCFFALGSAPDSAFLFPSLVAFATFVVGAAFTFDSPVAFLGTTFFVLSAFFGVSAAFLGT
jgi:hypothetical protein